MKSTVTARISDGRACGISYLSTALQNVPLKIDGKADESGAFVHE